MAIFQSSDVRAVLSHPDQQIYYLPGQSEVPVPEILATGRSGTLFHELSSNSPVIIRITAPLTVVFAANIFGQARLGTVSGLISMVHQIAEGAGSLRGGCHI